MASVTICSDFGAQKIKSVTVSIVSPSISHKVMGPQSCPTLCDPVDCSTPGFFVHNQLPELAQTHIHRVSELVEKTADFKKHLNTLFFGAPKSLQMVTAAMKLKDAYSLEGKFMIKLDSIFKSRDITLPTKVHLAKAMVFPVVIYG